MSQRRDALKIIGSIGATCAFPFAADELYAQHEGHAAAEAAAVEPKYFTREDLALIALVAEHIIPATDTPGAIAAGVPAYIDLVVSRNNTQKKIFAAGLAWLKEKKFSTRKPAQQIALLQPLCDAVDRRKVKSGAERFFRSMKALTADGYWTSKAGMGTTLGFKGAAMLAEYPECREH
jgi:hypothetical protein